MKTPETSETPESTSAGPVPASNPKSAPPQDIDQIINNFLGRANAVANDKASDPKAVCSLGWLVLKIKQFQAAQAGPTPNADGKPAGLSESAITQIEQAGKML